MLVTLIAALTALNSVADRVILTPHVRSKFRAHSYGQEGVPGVVPSYRGVIRVNLTNISNEVQTVKIALMDENYELKQNMPPAMNPGASWSCIEAAGCNTGGWWERNVSRSTQESEKEITLAANAAGEVNYYLQCPSNGAACAYTEFTGCMSGLPYCGSGVNVPCLNGAVGEHKARLKVTVVGDTGAVLGSVDLDSGVCNNGKAEQTPYSMQLNGGRPF